MPGFMFLKTQGDLFELSGHGSEFGGQLRALLGVMQEVRAAGGLVHGGGDGSAKIAPDAGSRRLDSPRRLLDGARALGMLQGGAQVPRVGGGQGERRLRLRAIGALLNLPKPVSSGEPVVALLSWSVGPRLGFLGGATLKI